MRRRKNCDKTLIASTASMERLGAGFQINLSGPKSDKSFGDHGAPFRWDTARRFQIRRELDAAFFHLYGIHRDDVATIMDTFPFVRRKDERDHGTYRTKLLRIYMEPDLLKSHGIPTLLGINLLNSINDILHKLLIFSILLLNWTPYNMGLTQIIFLLAPEA